MTIERFKELYEGTFPTKNKYTAITCDDCSCDIAFYHTEIVSDIDDSGYYGFRDHCTMNDTFSNQGGDVVYQCNHCDVYVCGGDPVTREYATIDEYIADHSDFIEGLKEYE